MTTHKHIVQVHPVENGEPNLHKVLKEIEYDTKEVAEGFIKWYNAEALELEKDYKAVYLGRVNDETGELE
jgi:hypothetical protein